MLQNAWVPDENPDVKGEHQSEVSNVGTAEVKIESKEEEQRAVEQKEEEV